MDVLVHLAANPDRVVSKEELLTVVWDGAFVEEGALAQAIHSLRKALGDDARQPRFIQTVPKRGYRLVARPSEERPFRRHSSTELSLTSSLVEILRELRFLAAVVAAAIGLTLWLVTENFAAPPRITALPFENLGGPQSASLAEGLTVKLSSLLVSLPYIDIAPSTRLRTGNEKKSDYLLEGTVRRLLVAGNPPKALVTLQLVRIDSDTCIFSKTYKLDEEGPLQAQEKISQQMARDVATTLVPEQGLVFQQKTSKADGDSPVRIDE